MVVRPGLIWGPGEHGHVRSRAPRTRAELGWIPDHTDMLSMVGEPRLRELAAASPATAPLSAR